MGRIMKSLTIGGIIGFIVGLLFAPKKGEETRKNLQESIEKGKSRFQELKEEIIIEARKIATNEVSSCYMLVQLTRQLIELEKGLVGTSD